jgi:malate dehydrogenase (oxaloacetate-decarboxylating)(NADP+)
LGKFKHIPDRYFLIASRVLADLVSSDDLELGRVYPRLDDIREISKVIAVRLIEQAYEENLATLYPRPDDLYNFITYRQYDFSYNHFLPDTWPWPDVTY